MDNTLLHVGFGNYLAIARIVAIAMPKSAPIKRGIQEAWEKGRIIDLTCGHRTKSVVFTDSGYTVLTGLEGKTIHKRIKGSV